MAKKKLIGCLVLVMLLVGGDFFFAHNASRYEEPVFKIEKVRELSKTPTMFEQTLTGHLLNKQKQPLQLTHTYYYSEADSVKLNVGDVVFLEDNLQAVSQVKRDRQTFRLIGCFLLVLYLFSSAQFARNIAIIVLNTVAFVLIAKYMSQKGGSLIGAMVLYSFVSVALTSLFINRQFKKRMAIFLSTIGGTFLAWGIALGVLYVTHHGGLRYEEMGIVTRPYRSVYYASLLIGTLGATTDIAVTILSTIGEVLEQQPKADVKTLYKVSRNVGQNILGPMTNVLFFVCLSEIIPMSLLYLENGWTYQTTFSSLISLELFRALTGGLGIALTIPLSVLVGSQLLRGDNQ
ncbi:YibE/F family protein [Vagococcus xieshaowenii]|uniref:YibE/F family protein n=1 Tax=Vagococcus xieshaowenii TaxID=2562451 RepID=A0AAJ5JLD2_9ENTE|nr:YibE/F family protein [Vagococcus xieshaowenii]QCA27882.1 YibE/F family protein [Vagococcus xieshaowenii]TFZ39439.1 YibE/F family protein [Vagococcus xieshaowenii]